MHMDEALAMEKSKLSRITNPKFVQMLNKEGQVGIANAMLAEPIDLFEKGRTHFWLLKNPPKEKSN